MPKTKTWRKKELGAKEKLMDTAVDLFAAKGFAGTSIRDIAKAMNVSASSIYHFFGNKEGLWIAILRYSAAELPITLREIAQLDMDPLDRLRLLLKTHLEYSEKHRRESKILLIDQDTLSPEGKRINRKLQAEVMEIYIEQLRVMQDLGILCTPHLKVAAFNVFGVLNWVLRWHSSSGELGTEKAYNEVVDFIIRGLVGLHWKK